jgi:hypothetical protein
MTHSTSIVHGRNVRDSSLVAMERSRKKLLVSPACTTEVSARMNEFEKIKSADAT